MVIADLGAGDGYFTHRLARAVAPGGKVIALDIDQRALDINKGIATDEGLANVETRLVSKDLPGLQPGEADLVFICKAWHALPDRLCYARQLAAVLKPTSRIAVIGSGLEPMTIASRRPGTTDRYEVERQAEAGGLRLVREHELPHQFFVELALGRSEIYDRIPGFQYITSELAVGAAPWRKASFTALAQRGFLQVLDIRAGPDPVVADAVETAGLRYVRVDRASVARAVVDPKNGVSFLLCETGAHGVTIVKELHRTGWISLSPCESSRLNTLDE